MWNCALHPRKNALNRRCGPRRTGAAGAGKLRHDRRAILGSARLAQRDRRPSSRPMPARLALVALSSLARPVDRAALGNGAGRHALPSGRPWRRRRCGASGRRCSPASPSALAYNFFFTAPIHTFRIDRVDRRRHGRRPADRRARHQPPRRRHPQAGADRRSACRAQRDHRRFRAAPAVAAAAKGTSPEVACDELRRLFDCNAMLVSGLPAARRLWPRRRAGNRLTPSDIAAAALAHRIWRSRQGAARRGSSPPNGCSIRSGPARQVLAAAGLARDDGAPPVEERGCRCLINLLDQVALALERARLEDEAREFATVRERDRLRAALLSSIGQDLRPRLTAIGGAVRELRRSGTSDKAAGLDHRRRRRPSSTAISPICSISVPKATSARSRPAE